MYSLKSFYNVAGSLLASVVLFTGCAFFESQQKYTKESTPRVDQKRWPSEVEVINVVVDCVRMADFYTGHDKAVREYATFIRRVYGTSSEGGLDVDAGVRAVNYIKKIHADAKGGKKLWKEVMKMAKHEPANEEQRLPGLPPPM